MAETSYQTTATYSELLARPDIAPMFYVLISGIPYAFGNLGVPEAWDTGSGVVSIDSEDYTWSQTLIVREDFGGLSQKAEPKRGLGTAGGQTFEFKLTGTDAPEDDLWFSLLLKNLHRTDKAATNLDADLDADTSGGAATITVVDASDFATSAQSVYIGTETITVGSASNTSTTLHNIATRGAYKSWAQAHRVTTDPTREATAGGPYVATWPLVWEGRVVRLYMALGQWVSGTWRPYRDASDDPVTQEVYAGLITGVREGGDTLTINTETASIDQLLANKVGARLPQTSVFKHQRGASALIHVGPHNWRLMWSFLSTDTTNAPVGYVEPLPSDTRLVDSSDTPVTEGLYSLPEIADFIVSTIINALPVSDPSDTVSGAFTVDTNADGDPVTRLNIWINSSKIGYYELTLYPRSIFGPCITRDLGWGDSEATFEASNTSGDSNKYESTPRNTPPWFRWPSLNDPAPTRIYIEKVPTDGLAFNTSPGWVDDDGSSIPAAALIKEAKEIVTITTVATDANHPRFQYLAIGTRGIYNTGQFKEYELKYDQNSDKSCEIVQGIYLPNVSLHRALLYLWHSGSGAAGTMHATWDKGWESSGLALPSDFININEITSVAADIQPKRDQIWIGEEIELRRWLESELLIEQVMMLARADFDAGTGYKLTWVRTIPPPLYTGNVTERALDHTRLKTDLNGNGVQIDRQENKLINAVTVRCAYDHATKKFNTTIDQNHVTSQQVWGVRERITLDVKTISGLADAQQLAVRLAKRVFDRYAHPYDIVEVDAAYAPTWAWQIGDIVALTHEALPAVDSPGRGWSAEGTRLYVKRDNLTGAGGVSSRLTLVRGASMGARQTVIAPSALLTSEASGGSRDAWNVADHEFSASTDALDVSYFAAGYRVLLWLRGTADTEEATIGGVTGSIVEFSAGIAAKLGSGGDIVMMLANYGDIDASGHADQKKFAHMSDFTGVINDGATDDRPYKYF